AAGSVLRARPPTVRVPRAASPTPQPRRSGSPRPPPIPPPTTVTVAPAPGADAEAVDEPVSRASMTQGLDSRASCDTPGAAGPHQPGPARGPVAVSATRSCSPRHLSIDVAQLARARDDQDLACH